MNPSPAPDPCLTDPPRWRRVRTVTFLLLGVWFAVTFGPTFFARDLDQPWFGWPLSWWFASQGALLAYVLLIGAYAWAMSRIDDEDADDADGRATDDAGPDGRAG